MKGRGQVRGFNCGKPRRFLEPEWGGRGGGGWYWVGAEMRGGPRGWAESGSGSAIGGVVGQGIFYRVGVLVRLVLLLLWATRRFW